MVDYQDEVKNKVSGVVGVVITIYEKNGIQYLDVRVDERIYYETPAANWETIRAVDE